jgi:hypothetical protein
MCGRLGHREGIVDLDRRLEDTGPLETLDVQLLAFKRLHDQLCMIPHIRNRVGRLLRIAGRGIPGEGEMAQ